MAKTRFVLDPSFARAVARTPDAKRALERAGAACVPVARELAPDDPATVGDDLRGGIMSEVEMTSKGWRGYVRGTDWKTHFYEFGTVKLAAVGMLRKAVERVVGPLDARD